MYSINTLYHLTFININMIGILLTIQRFMEGNTIKYITVFQYITLSSNQRKTGTETGIFLTGFFS